MSQGHALPFDPKWTALNRRFRRAMVDTRQWIHATLLDREESDAMSWSPELYVETNAWRERECFMSVVHCNHKNSTLQTTTPGLNKATEHKRITPTRARTSFGQLQTPVVATTLCNLSLAAHGPGARPNGLNIKTAVCRRSIGRMWHIATYSRGVDAQNLDSARRVFISRQ